MKRIWSHIVSVIVAGIAASTLAPACVENDQTVFIRGALAPSANRQGGTCIYTPDPQQAELFEAVLDIGVTDSYFAVLLVGNQMTPRGDPDNNRAESSRIHINGGIVRVTEPDGTLVREFTSASSGFADVPNTNTPGGGLTGLITFDAETKNIVLGMVNPADGRPLLATREDTKMLVMNIKVFGQSLGNQDFETGEFQLPIQVCNGCLVSFANSNDPAQNPQPNCLKPLDAAAASSTSGPCIAGQDGVTPCQLCQGRKACDPAQP